MFRSNVKTETAEEKEEKTRLRRASLYLLALHRQDKIGASGQLHQPGWSSLGLPSLLTTHRQGHRQAHPCLTHGPPDGRAPPVCYFSYASLKVWELQAPPHLPAQVDPHLCSNVLPTPLPAPALRACVSCTEYPFTPATQPPQAARNSPRRLPASPPGRTPISRAGFFAGQPTPSFNSVSPSPHLASFSTLSSYCAPLRPDPSVLYFLRLLPFEWTLINFPLSLSETSPFLFTALICLLISPRRLSSTDKNTKVESESRIVWSQQSRSNGSRTEYGIRSSYCCYDHTRALRISCLSLSPSLYQHSRLVTRHPLPARLNSPN